MIKNILFSALFIMNWLQLIWAKWTGILVTSKRGLLRDTTATYTWAANPSIITIDPSTGVIT